MKITSRSLLVDAAAVIESAGEREEEEEEEEEDDDDEDEELVVEMVVVSSSDKKAAREASLAWSVALQLFADAVSSKAIVKTVLLLLSRMHCTRCPAFWLNVATTCLLLQLRKEIFERPTDSFHSSAMLLLSAGS